MASNNLQIRSTVVADGTLELGLVEAPLAEPGAGEVVVRIEAAPINPADLIPLLAGAAVDDFTFNGSRAFARLSAAATASSSARAGIALPVGLEGAGTVTAAGPGAEGWLGKTVAVMAVTGGTFARYCTFPVEACVPLPASVSAREGAALFTNPLTALAMVETLRLEGKTALVHTAAASNLGRMLVRICAEDGIALVNVVRRAEHADLLRSLGARWVCDSSASTFEADLHAALVETGATIAFDAIAGGEMAGRLVAAMERAAVARSDSYSPYGSSEYKQVFIYGGLDPAPTTLPRGGYGMTWSVAGWAMPPALARAGVHRQGELIERILAGLTTTFASHYSETIPLRRVLDRDTMADYTSLATGRKYLIDPWS